MKMMQNALDMTLCREQRRYKKHTRAIIFPYMVKGVNAQGGRIYNHAIINPALVAMYIPVNVL